MLLVVIGLSILVGFLLTYLFYIKKEIRSINKQLRDYTEFKNRKKIDISLFDKDIESLAQEINNNIDVFTKLQADQNKKENILKDTIANISHDLRTPLTSVLGYIQIMRRGEFSNNIVKKYLSKIEERAKDLQSLLDDFFTLSLVESSDYKLTFQKINLYEVFTEVITGFYDEFSLKGVEPKIIIRGEDFSILGDLQAVKRIIENLISNLLKHSKGNVEILLEDREGSIVLIIKDKAVGLIQSDVNHLFDRFYKADKSRGINKNSTGLGLSIVGSFMEKMKGRASARLEGDFLLIECEWNKFE
ncbi:sensor histidine kinase [Clostridium sp. B9]|uniref:sensor histidine kinase n=1 Tax=Clostridium sp. B9 TaxID=3423224 RepID=UPI003D2ECE4D